MKSVTMKLRSLLTIKRPRYFLVHHEPHPCGLPVKHGRRGFLDLPPGGFHRGEETQTSLANANAVANEALGNMSLPQWLRFYLRGCGFYLSCDTWVGCAAGVMTGI